MLNLPDAGGLQAIDPSRPDQVVGRRSPESALSHIDRLEAESIHIMREAVAESENPVMLYSIG